MLGALLVFIFILYTITSCLDVKKTKVEKYIICAFNFFWCLALFFSLFFFTGKYAISTEAYLLIIVALYSFNKGFKIKKNISFQLNALTQSAKKIIENKLFNCFVLILLSYVISLLLMYIDALAMASAADLRTDFFDEENNLYGPFFFLLNTWFLKPVSVFLLPLFPISLIQKKYRQALLYLLYLLAYNSLGGGRFGYTQIAWSIYLVLFCLYPILKIRLSFRNIIIGSIMFIGFYSLIALTTASRMANFDVNKTKYVDVIEETNSQLFAYASGPIAAFSYALDHNYIQVMGGYQYGKLTLGAIDQVLDIFFRKFGVNYERSIPKLASIKQDSKIEINKDFTMWNALYTSNLFFYLDFGIIGILIFPFLFARLFSKALSLMCRKQTIISLVLVNYIFINCMHSVFDFRLYNITDLVIIIVMLILIYKKWL